MRKSGLKGVVNKMEISGMNSVYRFYTLEYFFEAMSEYGINNVELWTSPHHFFVDYAGYNAKDLERIKNLKEKHNIVIHCICPEQTNPKVGNLAVEHKEARKRMLSYFKHQIYLAKELEASKVLVTAGWGYLDETKEFAWERSVSAMQKICDYAKDSNINIVVEALQPEESNLVNNLSDLQKYVEDVDHPNLKVCIDFGAMARANDTLEAYFSAFPDLIEHIHFVDGKPTGHLALGDGNRDLEQDLKTLQKNHYTQYLTLESVNSIYYMDPKKADKKSIKTYQKIKGVLNND